jgi:hypothetical protein
MPEKLRRLARNVKLAFEAKAEASIDFFHTGTPPDSDSVILETLICSRYNQFYPELLLHPTVEEMLMLSPTYSINLKRLVFLGQYRFDTETAELKQTIGNHGRKQRLRIRK